MLEIELKIHVVPGVDARAAARDLVEFGAVGIDDIGENTHEAVQGEILDELGHAADELDLRPQRVNTALGPVFVVRNAAVCSAADVRSSILVRRGKP